ncbi:chaperonin family protein RbcX [Prochlorothrix hollandica]|uniref:RbcX chaperonin protein n=1 Tax=Prochlorothrix hollandica PCC 9006 = CALU 1027 TaxID=317619 RepID=A0A0M2PTZ8_PROHO|nr:chaperonin family protein RbcX [Prochlorothrix hollandica]KKI98153.1 RbcX chaperonin protein [Prochlorothrix hollandica PCC 9006 = CALU 1027]
MDLRKISRDSAQTLANYLTYQAVRVVLDQLTETNPPQSLWLREFSAQISFQQGSEDYLQHLMQANQELAFRIMTVRDHLATNIPEFLPEMVRSQVQEANLQQRKVFFERLTQTPLGPEVIHPEVHLPLDLRSLPPDRAADSAA